MVRFWLVSFTKINLVFLSDGSLIVLQPPNKIISKNSHSYSINNKINNKYKKTKNSINNQGIIKKNVVYIY